VVVHEWTLSVLAPFVPSGTGLLQQTDGFFRKRNHPSPSTLGLKLPVSADNLGRAASQIHRRMPLVTAVLPPEVNELLRPKTHVRVQADQKEQVVKLVVPPISSMALMMGLNLLEEFALMLLSHGLRGPLDLFWEGYLLGQILVHRALLDEIPKEVAEVLDVLSAGGIG
jgi:hypothetical protein